MAPGGLSGYPCFNRLEGDSLIQTLGRAARSDARRQPGVSIALRAIL